MRPLRHGIRYILDVDNLTTELADRLNSCFEAVSDNLMHQPA